MYISQCIHYLLPVLIYGENLIFNKAKQSLTLIS